jgi:hypothetical protein
MNRELSRIAHLRTARPLVARVAAIHRLQGSEGVRSGAQGAPDERSQRPIPPLGRGRPPSGGQPLTAPTRPLLCLRGRVHRCGAPCVPETQEREQA